MANCQNRDEDNHDFLPANRIATQANRARSITYHLNLATSFQVHLHDHDRPSGQ